MVVEAAYEAAVGNCPVLGAWAVAVAVVPAIYSRASHRLYSGVASGDPGHLDTDLVVELLQQDCFLRLPPGNDCWPAAGVVQRRATWT